MDTIGKRFLHAFFGIIVGSGIGGYMGSPEHVLPGIIIGAIICGLAAFFVTDKFWESLRDYF